MALTLIVSGPLGMIDRWSLTIAIVCIVLSLVMFVGCVTIHCLRIRKHGFKIRHVLLLITAVLLVVDLINNAVSYPSIQYYGSVDLLPYYVVRSLSFLPSGATHTLVILLRTSLLVILPGTRRTFLRISTAVVTLADVVAVLGMWDATLKVVPIGTLDEWQWRWRFPLYGVAASGVFPLINVIACGWSLRVAFLMSRGPAEENGVVSIGHGNSSALGTSSAGTATGHHASHQFATVSASQHSVVGAAASSSVALKPCPDTASAVGSSTGQVTKASDAPRRMLRAVSSISVRSKTSAARRTVSATEASITRSFWLLTILEMLCWFAFMATIGSGTPTLPLFTRNAVYSCYGLAGVSVETAFEFVYKLEYTQASSRPSMVKAIDPGTGVRTSHVSYKVAELEAHGHLSQKSS